MSSPTTLEIDTSTPWSAAICLRASVHACKLTPPAFAITLIRRSFTSLSRNFMLCIKSGV